MNEGVVSEDFGDGIFGIEGMALFAETAAFAFGMKCSSKQ
jgi:hypothetical protein